MQILILGAHRSGTSALTRLINMMGAYVGSEGATIGYNDENPKGFWERRDVIELNDDLLAHYNCRWDDLSGWPVQGPQMQENALPEALASRIRSVVLEMDHHRPWAMKDPRLCETFALWRPFLEMPLAVLAWRDPYEVAVSLHRRNGFSLLHGLALWEHAMISAIESSRQVPFIVVSYQQMMQSPVAQVARLYDWAVRHHVQGLRKPQDEEILRFIDPALYRSRPQDRETMPALSATQQQLLTWLQQASGQETPDALPALELSPVAKEVMALVHQQRQTEETLQQAQQQLGSQTQQITDLRQQVTQAQQEQKPWALAEHDWLHQCNRITALETRLGEEVARLDHRVDLLGDAGRIRRRISKLLAFVGG